MNKLFITTSILLFTFFNITAQEKKTKMKKNSEIIINEINIYPDFSGKGYTTAGAYTHFNDLKENNVETVLINNSEVLKIQNILNKSSRKKHYQTKLGQNIIFFEMKLYGVNSYNRMIITHSKNGYIFVDLSRNVNFFINDKEDVEWISEFIDKIQIMNK